MAEIEKKIPLVNMVKKELAHLGRNHHLVNISCSLRWTSEIFESKF